MSLKTFLSPEEIEAVMSFDGKSDFLHFSGDTLRLTEVFSWGRLNNCLNTASLPSTDIRLFKEGRSLSYNGSIDLIRETANGATLIHDDIDRKDIELGRVLDAVTGEMGFRTRANLYLSYPETQGFHAHYDTHAFLILQISGKKKWNIYRNQEASPLYVQKHHPTLTEAELSLSEEVLLEEGDVLFVPKGQWHDATAKDGPSVHLTLALFAPTGIDFLDWLTDELREELSCRLDFPWGKNALAAGQEEPDNALKLAIERVAASVNQKLSEKTLAADFLAHGCATISVRDRLHFPQHIESNSCIGDGDSFLLASKTLSYFGFQNDGFVHLVGGELSMAVPSELIPAIDLMTASDGPFALVDLENTCTAGATQELSKFITTLLIYGIIRRV
ncbi:MAG: JmjC domain-containing protein [Paracoccaceae bacterium]